MSAGKLILLYALWVIASAAIAIAVAGFIAIVLDFFGLGGVRIVFDVVGVLVFVLLVTLPFLLRNKTAIENRPDGS